jgi:glycosyltransferase involved in cell wall biosynthesis
VNSNPLVSAIIPTYNRAHLVTDAVDSILGQTYPEVEIIVVDDGSTDDTLARLARYGSRIRVISQKNAGPAAARNRGIAAATGEFVAFLDSDDLWLPEKLERQVRMLERAGRSVPCCVSNITMRFHKGERSSFDIAALHPDFEEGIWTNVDEVLATRFLLFNQAVLVRREVLEKVGGFDETLWLLEDYEIALRLSLEGPWAYIREPLVIWRESRSGSLYQSVRQEEARLKEPLVQILEQHLASVVSRRRGRLRRYVCRELARARRTLHAARLAAKDSWAATIAARSLQRLERFRRAVYVRSPLFPRMAVQKLGRELV